jgi:hypothetical protein
MPPTQLFWIQDTGTDEDGYPENVITGSRISGSTVRTSCKIGYGMK